MLHYPYYSNNDKNKYTKFSLGKIIKTIKNNFEFTCFSQKGSSGGPILRLNNFKVIGIHKGKYNNKENLKIGINIKNIIEDLEYSIKKNNISLFAIISIFWIIFGMIEQGKGVKQKNGPLLQSGFWIVLGGKYMLTYVKSYQI